MAKIGPSETVPKRIRKQNHSLLLLRWQRGRGCQLLRVFAEELLRHRDNLRRPRSANAPRRGQGELSLPRRLWAHFRPGDVLLTECLLSTWTFKRCGFEFVSHLNKAKLQADFRRGKRLGNDDHHVRWPEPRKPRSID